MTPDNTTAASALALQNWLLVCGVIAGPLSLVLLFGPALLPSDVLLRIPSSVHTGGVLLVNLLVVAAAIGFARMRLRVAGWTLGGYAACLIAQMLLQRLESRTLSMDSFSRVLGLQVALMALGLLLLAATCFAMALAMFRGQNNRIAWLSACAGLIIVGTIPWILLARDLPSAAIIILAMGDFVGSVWLTGTSLYLYRRPAAAAPSAPSSSDAQASAERASA